MQRPRRSRPMPCDVQSTSPLHIGRIRCCRQRVQQAAHLSVSRRHGNEAHRRVDCTQVGDNTLISAFAALFSRWAPSPVSRPKFRVRRNRPSLAAFPVRMWEEVLARFCSSCPNRCCRILGLRQHRSKDGAGTCWPNERNMFAVRYRCFGDHSLYWA